MAAAGHSITAEAFALAVTDLPLENIYGKAAELQNSITHLLSSNVQMEPFATDGDEICRDAIQENKQVIERLEERIELCKAEVEKRGMSWMGGSSDRAHQEERHPHASMNGTNGITEGGRTAQPQRPSGRLTDEDLRRQLESQLDNSDDEGLHL